MGALQEARVREASESDLPALKELFEEVETLPRRALPEYSGPSRPHPDDRLRAYLRREDAGILVAESAGEISGLVQFEVVIITRRGPARAQAFLSTEDSE